MDHSIVYYNILIISLIPSQKQITICCRKVRYTMTTKINQLNLIKNSLLSQNINVVRRKS